LFAQATTVGLALLFVVTTLRPEWLKQSPPAPGQAPVVTTTTVQQTPGDHPPRANALGSFADAARKAMPAVVNVYTTKEIRRGLQNDDPLFERFFGERFRGQNERVMSLGSGVIATTNGYVLTNNHVVQAADEIAISLSDGRKFDAKLVGSDPETDVALLRIDAPNLPSITFGRSETLKVGDVVLAIGNPFDVGQTVTMGIVSALGRTNLGINRYENFIQTDAAINQGNSGGALVDSNGHLIGINTAIYSRTGGSIGIGFAIPTTTLTQVMEQLIKTGKVVRGYFGIEPLDITPELVDMLKLQRAEGVVVRMVQSTAPAGRAGMEPGDVLLAINGEPVKDSTTMLNQIAALAPGTQAMVKVLRASKEIDLTVTVGERPQLRR
jgi:serine protease DegQ